MYGIYYASMTGDILMGSMSPYIPYMDPSWVCDDMCLKHLKTLKYEMIPAGFD